MFNFKNPFKQQISTQEDGNKSTDIHEKFDKCFNKIAGYDNIKSFLTHYFESKEDLNVLLQGSPATSKTLFLRAVQEKYGKDCIYYDFSNSTGRGFIKHLIAEYKKLNILTKNKTFYLLLDEIEKITPLSDLNMILNLLEDNEIHYVKSGVNVHIKMKVKIFATANNIENLSKHFKSRFFILELKEYDLIQFIEIARKISEEYLKVKNKEAREEIAEEIATRMFELNIKDIRQIRDIMKIYNIYKGDKTVQEVLEFRLKYMKDIGEDEE